MSRELRRSSADRVVVRVPPGELLVACALEGLDHADVVAVAVAADLVGAAAAQLLRATPDELLCEAAAPLLGDDADVADDGRARVPGGHDHPRERAVLRVRQLP